ncbi:CBO0543 family protein [Virgibacillus xinjiangensis]|uniref:CBO0543 family protein n=1 Tax=Virgibacillus xinjiangensis TaxID=393090 RepID=A0ABV7CQQ1_9BACI
MWNIISTYEEGKGVRAIHLALATGLLIALLRWGDWDHIREYYPTMLIMAIADLAYEAVANEYYYLWKIHPDFFLDDLGVLLLHAVVLYPFSAFLFLSNYPETLLWRIIHYAKWVAIYLVLEMIAYRLGVITYDHGWNLFWSSFFLIHMFLFLRLHYLRPLWAVIASVPSALFYMFMFGMI